MPTVAGYQVVGGSLQRTRQDLIVGLVALDYWQDSLGLNNDGRPP